MRVYKLFPILFLFILGCAGTSSVTVAQKRPKQEIPKIKGLIPIFSIGEQRLGTSFISHPRGVLVTSLGDVFITDAGNHRVVKCDTSGNFISEVGGFGWGTLEFNRPAYMTTDNGLNVYVADTENKRVQRFDRNLNFISFIQAEPKDDFSGLGLIQGIGVEKTGRLILSDMENDCLVRLNNFFEFEESFAGFGEGEGSVLDPHGLAIDNQGDILVTDSGRDRIVVFDSFGGFLKEIGSRILKSPQGVDVGTDGTIYVANTEKNNIVIFSSQGDLIIEYGGGGTDLGKFSQPTDVKVFKDKKLFVVDSSNNRVQVLEIIR